MADTHVLRHALQLLLWDSDSDLPKMPSKGSIQEQRYADAQTILTGSFQCQGAAMLHQAPFSKGCAQETLQRKVILAACINNCIILVTKAHASW